MNRHLPQLGAHILLADRVETMSIYIAGPMRGMPQFNFPAFYDAEERLTAAGHTVFNPARHDNEQSGFIHEGRSGHEDLTELGFNLREALATDLTWIARHADAVCLLPGWHRSNGAIAELALASALSLVTGSVDQLLSGATTSARDAMVFFRSGVL